MPIRPSPVLQRTIPIARAAIRLLLASAGGYALAAALAFTLARSLPMARAEATVTASLTAILAMPAATIWVYAVPRLWLAAAGISGLIALCAAVTLLTGQPA